MLIYKPLVLRVREEYKGTDVTYKEKEYYINLDTVIFVGEPFYENSKGKRMNLQIGENYLLTADTYNIILNKRYKSKQKRANLLSMDGDSRLSTQLLKKPFSDC